MFEYDPNIKAYCGGYTSYDDSDVIEAEVTNAETIEQEEGVEVFIADMPALVLTVDNTNSFKEN